MGKVFDSIDEKIRTWISNQKMFFVATAPLSGDGLINLSPKGLDSFRVLDDHTIAYLDYTGSGVETIAHIKENQRIVIMMCAFEGAPRIFRFHGRGIPLEKGTDEFNELIGNFDETLGARSIIKIDVERISDSCGFTVPIYSFQGDRDTLKKWAEQKGEEGVVEYQKNNNMVSLDGLEGLTPS